LSIDCENERHYTVTDTWVCRQAGRDETRQAGRQTDTGKHINRQADWQVGKQAEMEANRHKDRQ
jgi:hypothetical protein